MNDRPGREEDDRRITIAVDLVVDAHAVPLDIALLIGIARTALLALRLLPGRGDDAHRLLLLELRSHWRSHFSVQSRSSRWPAVIPDARSRIRPSLNVMTNATSASGGMSSPSRSRTGAKASRRTARHSLLMCATRDRSSGRFQESA